jgi:MFS family permease
VRAILRTPGVLTLFGASCVARLPMGALGLLLVLHTQELTGSYATGGLASGAYAAALGLSNPALARVVDRRGQTLVLRLGAPVAATAVAFVALLPASAPPVAIIAGAIVAGMTQPPVGACMRALWPELLDGPDARHAAYGLESAALEFVYICGPVALVAGIGSWSLPAAMLACAVAIAVGDLAFSLHPASRGWRPHPERVHSLVGALRAGGVRVLVLVFFSLGLAVGSVEVCVPAALDGMGHRELTGVLLGVWGVGSLLAGIVVAHTRAPADPPRRLGVLLVAFGAGHVALALAGAPATLGLVLLVAGATIAPAMTCSNGMLDHLAPAGSLTEAFTWTAGGMIVGAAIGSALAGTIVEAASPQLALAVLAGGGIVSGLLVRGVAAGALRRPAVAA